MRSFILLGLLALAACEAGDNDVTPVDGPTTSKEGGNLLPPEQPALQPSDAATVPTIVMPEFAPQYPGSTMKAVNSSNGGRQVHEVTLTTHDDAGKIMKFYRDKFLAAGLKKTSDFQSGGTGVLSAAARDRRASIAISKEGSQNLVIVTFSDG
ncbi:hypothetical protein ACFFV8_00395 [Sphingobium indicum]|uniref:hypothetical protein n=1 Tax=Sphingobium TaxID=165695 RepID=UPI001112ABAA|nr:MULTISPECIES: hypothetical protein [unclassified Sphingobium]